MPNWFKPGTTREQVEALRPASEGVPPPRPVLDTLTEIQISQPWYRRAWHFVTSAAGFLKIFGAIAGASLAGHAWIAGLVTKENVHDEVGAAVTAAMLNTNDRLTRLEDKTADFPGWKISTHDKVTTHEVKINALDKSTTKLEDRFDRYLRK